MDNNSWYFVELLKAFLTETTPAKPVKIDWRKIYELAHIHFVSGAIYLSIEKMERHEQPAENIMKKFKTDFLNTILRYENQEKVFREIIKILNEKKIKHLFFKGIVLCNYYPVKQMRTLGDIDFLFCEEDRLAVNEALLHAGYKNKSKTGHWQYTKDDILIEAHEKLVYKDINPNMKFVSYFGTVWDNVKVTDKDYTFELGIEFHLIYLLSHMAKHLYNNGAGIRMILDIAVIIKKFRASMDFSYLWNELKRLKLDIFAKSIFILCNRYFQVYVPELNIDIDNKTLDVVSDYIMEGGTFGFNNRNDAVHLVRREYESTDNLRLAQVKALWNKVFLNYENMKDHYCVKVPFLLPFGWIYRGIKCIVMKRKRTWRILRGFFNCSHKAASSYEVMKKIGL